MKKEIKGLLIIFLLCVSFITGYLFIGGETGSTYAGYAA